MMHVYDKITLPLLEAMEEKYIYFCWPETYVYGIDLEKLLLKKGMVIECEEGYAYGDTATDLLDNLKLLIQ